jgi:hypothetical protein
MCIGGAGGGGGGWNSVSTVGGSGGGSGGVSRALYNAQQLPDTLYVQVGLGGAGGAPNTTGSPGTRSWVSLLPAVVAQNLVQGSGAAVAAGGGSGTGASAAGETAINQTIVNFLTLSNFIGTAGQASPIYTTANVTPFSSTIVTAGAFGSVNAPAGSILSSSLTPLLLGGLRETGSGVSAANGADGITSWKPFFSTGGAGGGCAVSGSGGNGGNGGIGSGGGGGGGTDASLVGYTIGRGGNGGDGLVVIISF